MRPAGLEEATAGRAEHGYARGGLSAHYVLVLLCLTYMLDYADRMVVGSLLPFIRADWHLTDQQLGSLTSIVYFTIALFTIPLSLLVDRWSRRRMISIMVFVWSMATLACAFARDYGHLLAARACIGLGEAAYTPAGAAVLSAAYAMRHRARALGVWSAFIPVGAAIGFVVGGYVGSHYGWRNSFGLVAFPGLVLAVLYWFTRDYRTVPLAGVDGRQAGARELARAGLGLLRVPTLIFVYLGFAMNTAMTTAMLTWLPSYLHRARGLSETAAGNQAAGIVLLALIGAPLGGFLADRWQARREDARLVLSALTSLLSAAALAIALALPHTPAFWPALLVTGVLAVCYVAPATAVTQDVVQPGLRALAMSFCVVSQHVFGSAWSPMLVGGLSDRHGLGLALFALPAFSLVAALLLRLGALFYARDRARVAAIALVEE